MKKLRIVVQYLCVFIGFSIVALGIAVRFSMYGSEDTAYGSEYFFRILKAGFLPIFGTLDIYSNIYLTNDTLANNYTREYCLANSDYLTKDSCPYPKGVIFTFIALVVYLVIMIQVFNNLMISSFG